LFYAPPQPGEERWRAIHRKEYSMRKFLILTVTLVFAFFALGSSFAKPKKTGKVEKNVYTDSEFGFQITGLDNWKVKNQKNPSLLRVLMTQKNYKVSSIPGASKYTTTIPSVLVLADTTSLSLEQVEESLLGKGKLLQNIDGFMIKLDLIHNSEYLEIHDLMIDSIPARNYTLKQSYKKTGEDIRVRDPIYGSSVIIQDFLAGHLILFKKGNHIYVVQFSCEREFFYPTNSEFQKIISSWTFAADSQETK
jgi:hypothetical protein